MGYRELIKRVQHHSGFSDKESKEALDHMVEALAVRLNEGERQDFASQLPAQLQDLALSVQSTPENAEADLVDDFMTIQHVEEGRAKKQILSAWQALKEAVSEGEISHIRAQLSKPTVNLLH